MEFHNRDEGIARKQTVVRPSETALASFPLQKPHQKPRRVKASTNAVARSAHIAEPPIHVAEPRMHVAEPPTDKAVCPFVSNGGSSIAVSVVSARRLWSVRQAAALAAGTPLVVCRPKLVRIGSGAPA